MLALRYDSQLIGPRPESSPLSPAKNLSSTKGESLNADDYAVMPSVCRRTSERLSLTMPVVLIASHYGTAIISRGQTTDMSEGGMRVNVDVTLQDGQPVSVEFEAPTFSQTLKLQAQVKHRHQNVYGLQFDEPTDQQKHQIRLLIGHA